MLNILFPYSNDKGVCVSLLCTCYFHFKCRTSVFRDANGKWSKEGWKCNTHWKVNCYAGLTWRKGLIFFAMGRNYGCKDFSSKPEAVEGVIFVTNKGDTIGVPMQFVLKQSSLFSVAGSLHTPLFSCKLSTRKHIYIDKTKKVITFEVLVISGLWLYWLISSGGSKGTPGMHFFHLHVVSPKNVCQLFRFAHFSGVCTPAPWKS